MGSDKLFSLRRVIKRRPGSEAFRLELEALDVRRGDRLALVGPSGCGKSTALDLLAGVLRPDAGERFLFAPQAEAPALDMLELWRRGREDRLAAARLRHLGYVLQVGGLLPFLSAGENILLPCRALGNLAAQRESVRELTERLHIERLLRQMPSTLSVGERQRVAIARALAHGPSILLADEPTAALDPQHARLVLGLLAELAGERGTTVIMVTHAPDMAEEAGFRLVRVMTTQDREGAPFSRISHSDGEAA